jgi:hypothetical protein
MQRTPSASQFVSRFYVTMVKLVSKTFGVLGCCCFFIFGERFQPKIQNVGREQ